MRDDLRGRFLGYRRNLTTMFPIWLIVALDAVVGGVNRALLISQVLVLFAIFIAFGRFQARRVRKRMNAKVGYDIVASDALAPPTFFIPPVVRRPAARMPYVRYGFPLAVWSLVSGAALVAGAAISNAPDRSVGPVTFTPDSNSPLTTQQVIAIGLGMALAAVALAVVTGFVVGRRVRAIVPATVHESLTLQSRNAWLGATLIGGPAALVGALGVMPDLACASIGSALVLAGVASGVAALFVARRDAEIGRPISLAELLVGERDPSTPNDHQTAGAPDR